MLAYVLWLKWKCLIQITYVNYFQEQISNQYYLFSHPTIHFLKNYIDLCSSLINPKQIYIKDYIIVMNFEVSFVNFLMEVKLSLKLTTLH